MIKACLHYRLSCDSIVKIYNDKIEFYNPGPLPDSITVEDLLSNNYKSTPRNKLIADFCKSLGLIEKYGSGIKRIIEYCIADQNLTEGIQKLTANVKAFSFLGQDEDLYTVNDLKER